MFFELNGLALEFLRVRDLPKNQVRLDAILGMGVFTLVIN